MVSLTAKEREALLVLFKDFTNYYNANSISKVLGITRIGAQKIFKRCLKENLLISRRIGKSIIYKPNFKNEYVTKLISFLLADEANNHKRWLEEFKALFKKDRIVMMHGSAIKNYVQAGDIDMMIIIEKKDYKEVKKIIKERQEFLPKKIHSIELTKDDFSNNIKKKQEAIIDIIKNAIVLNGQDSYIRLIENVTSL